MRNFVILGAAMAALIGLLFVSGDESAQACPPAASASSAVSSPSSSVVVQSSPARPRGLLVGLRDRNRGSSATAVSISKVETGRAARSGVRERMSTARDVRKAMRSANSSSVQQSSTIQSSTVWQHAAPVTVLSTAPGGGASASASASTSAAVPAAVIAPQPVEVAPPERPLLPSGILPPAPRSVPGGGGAAASSSAASS